MLSEARKRAAKKYQETHKEEVQAQRREYREKNKEEIAAKKKAYREANKEKIAAKKAEWHKKNSKTPEYKEYQQAYKRTDKAKTYKQAWRQANKDKEKSYRLKAYYNIDIVKYNNMMAIQSGCCAICKIHQLETSQPLHVDHDHETGKVRGLLCHICNKTLGGFQDDIEILKSAISYLENAK